VEYDHNEHVPYDPAAGSKSYRKTLCCRIRAVRDMIVRARLTRTSHRLNRKFQIICTLRARRRRW